MSLQSIIDSAQSIEINRSKLVGQTISRSGRILTATRNWANPFRMVIVPKPIWRFSEARSIIEDLMTNDRNTSHSIQLGAVSGAAWTIGYQGAAPGGTTGGGGTLTNITITGMTGSTISLANCPLAGNIFLKGDYIQPISGATSYRYPFVVTQNLIGNGSANRTVTVHRSFMPQTGYTLNPSNIKVGTSCVFTVMVTALPTYRLVSGQFVEFTGNFELVEEIL
jgi:hypothetical protein